MDTLNKQADLISVVCIQKSEDCEDLSQFSKSNGFVLHECDDFLSKNSLEKLKLSDLILIESDIDKLESFEHTVYEVSQSDLSFKPAIFLVLSQYPDKEKRRKLIQTGYDDFLIKPFSIEELKARVKVFLQLKTSIQNCFVQKEKLEKSFEYLDKFKDDLKETKTLLFEERTTLNNAFKQVNQMTLERKRIKKEIKTLKSSFQENTDGFSKLISNLVTTRVEKNKGHSERVANIANYIAKQLGINEKKLEDLRKAAMLHESGLLLVPENILQKPEEEQSDYEKAFFIQYPVKGADLLLNCSEFDNCAKIISSLNENSDGTGTPKGLKRRYIPLLSRILAGADLFDTLIDEFDISPLEDFLEYLEQFSGTRLDPNIVALLGKYAVFHMGSDSYKVKGVGVHQLETGMILATALFTNTGTKLFSVNTLLTGEAIDKIKKYNREYPVDEIVYIRV